MSYYFGFKLALVYHLSMATSRAADTLSATSRAGKHRGRRIRSMVYARETGYWALLAVTFILPLDLDRAPLLWTGYLTVTNLTVGLLALAMLAIVTLVSSGNPGAGTAEPAPTSILRYFRERSVPLGLFTAILLSATISIFLAHRSAQGLTWCLDVAIGALLWLVVPVWLAPDPEKRAAWLAKALVAGAVVAAIVGLVEVMVGPSFDHNLTAFKSEATTLGPYIRLSGTFSHANVAAMFFELVLPFAAIGLIQAMPRIVETTLKSTPAASAGNGKSTRAWLGFAAWLAVFDLLLVAVLLTYTRGALLGIGASALFMILASRKLWNSGAVRTAWLPPAITVANLVIVASVLALATSSIELLRFTSQNDSAWYQAGYVSKLPGTMPTGRATFVPVTVINRSPLTWDAASPHSYGLSYHWLLPSRSVVRFANPITWLTAKLPPGGRETVRAAVFPPDAPGKYLLVWDLTWKGTTWFGPKTDVYTSIPIVVTRAGIGAGNSASSPSLPPPDTAILPNNRPLDRSQIWSVAWRMIASRPAFGEGPEGVRMNYDSFTSTTPNQASSPAPSHAHNLVLEIAADWGLLGLLLWVALVGVLWWPLVLSIWRGRVNSLWQLAVIGALAAFLAHGTVDYFLSTQAIFVMIWLLSALAASQVEWVPKD